MKLGIRIGWIAAAVGLNLLPLVLHWRGVPTGPAAGFAVAPPTPAADSNATPRFAAEFLDPAFHTPSVHVASVCELAGGRLLAVWYGGTREGHPDVAIFLATREPGAAHWTAAKPLVTAASAERELDRHVRKVGNAVVFSDGNQRVWLLYVTIAVGGWSGSSLNLKTSSDGGQTWSRSERLVLSPTFGVSELSKNQPAALAGGGWCVPIYHELLGKLPELLWLPADGSVAAAHRTRPFGGATGFQPSLVPLSSQRALLACRDVTAQRQVQISRSEDAGRSWSSPKAAGLPNPHSGLDAIRLRDGRVLLAFNDCAEGREVLGLALSPDGGVTWRRAGTLEREPGQEFSYPFLLETRDGLIHAVYTWKRKGIKQATFNVAWLEAQMEGVAR
jgi:predicted neuraminidase